MTDPVDAPAPRSRPKLVMPDLARAVRLAEHLLVLDQETARLVPFKLTPEQLTILETLLVAVRVCVLKGRQIGGSTVCALFLMLLALLNPGLPCCVVADQQSKADGILSKIRSWLGQLGVSPAKSNVRSIALANGSTIDALSAVSHADGGESRVGRSKSYGAIMSSEKAYWANASAVWASLTSTALSNAVFVDESSGAPGEDNLFRRTWVNAEAEGWVPLFFGVEQHGTYRADPDSISDEQWAQLREAHGFTRRDTAAWWWAKLHVDFHGDVVRCLREFPVTPHDAFIFAEGQHITRYERCEVVEDGPWNTYPGLAAEPLVLGVDTSAGLGQDASALALVGHKTGKPHRTWRDNATPIPAFTDVVWRAILEFRPVAVAVESNGVGQAVYQSVRAGVPPPGLFTAEELADLRDIVRDLYVYEQKSSNAPNNGELHERRALLKQAIESAEFPVGGHLLAEVQSSSVDKHRRFVGMDDVLSAVSFARKWRALNPYRAPAPSVDMRERYSIRDRLREARVEGGKEPTW